MTHETANCRSLQHNDKKRETILRHEKEFISAYPDDHAALQAYAGNLKAAGPTHGHQYIKDH